VPENTIQTHPRKLGNPKRIRKVSGNLLTSAKAKTNEAQTSLMQGISNGREAPLSSGPEPKTSHKSVGVNP